MATGCSSQSSEPEQNDKSTTTTSQSSSEKTPSPTTDSSATSEDRVKESGSQEEPSSVMGFTKAPGHTEPTPTNKTIQSCGTADILEVGTAFFTDGTSGWTEHCAAKMRSAYVPPTQEAIPEVAPQPAAEPIQQQNYVTPGAYCTDGVGVSKNGIPMFAHQTQTEKVAGSRGNSVSAGTRSPAKSFNTTIGLTAHYIVYIN